MSAIQVKVPDIGDFKEVEVIELLVKVGDTIQVDQSLVTVESDKASMEIPSSHAGVIKEMKVRLGDKIAEGSILLVVEAEGAAANATPAASAAPAIATAVVAAPAPVTAPAAAAVTGIVEVKVPDIGDFKEVEVIEVMVKAGDTIKVDQSLITVESDKASMEIPSSHAGVIKEIKVKVGDKVAEGSLLLLVEAVGATSAASAAVAAAAPAAVVATAPAVPAPVASSYTGQVDIECDMMVLGAGPGGYSAAFRSADLGMNTVLIEKYSTLGGVCLNVGCIPSKALLHVAAVIDETSHMEALGVTFAKPAIDIDKLRGYKESVIKKMTTGLSGMAKARKVNVVQGVGQFLSPYHIEVTAADSSKKVVQFKQAIIAAGSSVVNLPFVPVDPRIVDSTGALELRQVPKRMLVIGGGIIGLEMATVYSTLGARIDVVEMLDGLMQGADRDMVKVWQKHNEKRFDNIMLKTKTVGVEALPEGIKVTFASAIEGEAAPAPQIYDLVLVAVGRSPNGKKIAADKAGVNVTDRGFINVDKQMRTNVPHIFAIGDLVGQPMLAHKAVHEAHVAAEAAAGEKTYFDAQVIPSVAYTDPEVAWVGVTEDEAKAKGIKVEKGLFPWMASGRAVANGRDEGFTKLLFDAETKRIVGGGIVGTHAGDMIGEIALAIEMGADAVDIGKTIHPHPTLGESIGMAAEVYKGVCTDLPPQRKK
ncbi:dihydrolipoyl dehydrogenase [Undibacterium oligocarboniphilum]|uniref:Dihydrolipoyl dehydrogenase n=1 Tax=Undibacterium oligocarboniphilum TaxID=666702 RepID=A0A850QHK8_9BURK|nr:dihydrolipoyl dehydrogenase [Undibacterium oligocarboniphilum]MBC3871570.1 dihydrolipoyl dehydrogenase [Undibacterium oligocarboniphilum]NVO79071.1 dihydrolipoyl dehydrogenase [Undibacterium oligocarboniphilum]